jgi:metal-dependent HD superfamily phosphatase/phosphodiesterase
VLKLDLKVGEGVDIDSGRVRIKVESKSGQLARLSFEAAKDVLIRKIASVHTPASFARRGLSKTG